MTRKDNVAKVKDLLIKEFEKLIKIRNALVENNFASIDVANKEIKQMFNKYEKEIYSQYPDVDIKEVIRSIEND